MEKYPQGRGNGPIPHEGVKRLISLSWGKSLEISYKSIKVRFFRSMITVASLVLAVSFLSFILINLDLAGGFLASGGEQAARTLELGGYDVDREAMRVAMSAKERWIIFLSLLVCVVGIINAQLMAVTERFREIGVMKCLGALDSMVLRIFLLEAGMQGVAGAVIGAVLGLVFALLGGLIRFGGEALAHASVVAVFGSFGIAVLAGFVLSLAGVLYPAVVAMKMRPIVALRAEH